MSWRTAGPPPRFASLRRPWTGPLTLISSRCWRACRSARDRLIVAADGAGRAAARRSCWGCAGAMCTCWLIRVPLGCADSARCICTWCAGRTTRTARVAKSRLAARRPAGLPDRAGVRHLRIRADGRAKGRGRRLRPGELCSASQPVRLCGWTRSTTCSPPHRAGPASARRLRPASDQARVRLERRWTLAATIDEVARISSGMPRFTSTQVYAHPDPVRIRAAADAVPTPRELKRCVISVTAAHAAGIRNRRPRLRACQGRVPAGYSPG